MTKPLQQQRGRNSGLMGSADCDEGDFLLPAVGGEAIHSCTELIWKKHCVNGEPPDTSLTVWCGRKESETRACIHLASNQLL